MALKLKQALNTEISLQEVKLAFFVDIWTLNFSLKNHEEASKLTETVYLVKICFLEAFPRSYTREMVQAAITERFSYLGDKLENVEVQTVEAERKRRR
jgi:hypothetical protein